MDIELVDTSAWIDFFRGDAKAVKRIDALLEQDAARLCGPVYAELLSGSRNKAEQNHLKTDFQAIPWITINETAWERAADVRFNLARIGEQCGLLDVLIAQTAVDGGARLLTRDRDFVRIARVLPVELEVF